MPERRRRHETDCRSADVRHRRSDCRLWAVEAAARDPMGVEEAEGAEI